MDYVDFSLDGSPKHGTLYLEGLLILPNALYLGPLQRIVVVITAAHLP